MIVTAWNNGKHHASGAGYGIKIKNIDRDRYFNREWKTISLELEGEPEPIQIDITKESFWNLTCRELIHQNIGIWLLKQDLAPWKKGKPPQLDLNYWDGNHFRLSLR